MGEAKRRRMAVANAKPAPGLYGMLMRIERANEQMNSGQPVETDVECGTCQACCYHKVIDLEPCDMIHLGYLQTERGPEGKGLQLRKRDDGACIHLGDQGCMVYDHRPLACQAFDCRIYSVAGLVGSYAGISAPIWHHQPGSQREADLMTFLRMSANHIARNAEREGREWNIHDVFCEAIEATMSQADMIERARAVMDAADPEQLRRLGARVTNALATGDVAVVREVSEFVLAGMGLAEAPTH